MSEITTVDGLVVNLRPVSRLMVQRIGQAVEREFRERGEPLDPPRYTVQSVSGPEEHEHDAESIKDPATSEEDRAAWAAHQDAQARLAAEMRERTTKYLLLEGIRDAEPSEAWLEMQRRYGVPVADDPQERRLDYILSEVLRTPADVIEATIALTKLSMTGMEEEIAAAEAWFRRALQPRPAGRAAPEEGPVDGEPAPAGDGGGAAVGPDAEPVG